VVVWLADLAVTATGEYSALGMLASWATVNEYVG